MSSKARIAILGTGNIGRAMAIGLTATKLYRPGEVILTRRKTQLLDDLGQDGFQIQTDNLDAVRRAPIVVVAVEPQQANGLFEEIGAELDPERHLLISVVSGVSIGDILRNVGKQLDVVRAMPNTSIAIGQSMTCLAMNSNRDEVLAKARSIFDAVGKTLVIDEEQMVPATALCACGTAFFLRAIRAVSQGGIEIGFHPDEALTMAAQTALGAAALVLRHGAHPEREIDSVTTPRGCTIAGLNEMEHRGFSSSMIKGIVTSAVKADSLYSDS